MLWIKDIYFWSLLNTISHIELISKTSPFRLNKLQDQSVTGFVWNNKLAKVKRDTMIEPKEKGGLQINLKIFACSMG